MSSEGVAAADRALDILNVFTEHDSELTLAELASRTGFHKSTILRLADSLQKYSYLQRTPTGTFKIGYKALHLGYVYQCGFSFSHLVPQVLRQIVDEVQESASFYVRDGDERVCLLRHEPNRSIRDSIHVGNRLPLNVGAGGHVILAFSGTSGKKYARIRACCYAVSVGERDPDTAAIASPIFGVRNELLGVLSISGPRYRLEPRGLESFAPILLEHAAELTSKCGGDMRLFEVGRAAKR